MQIKDSDTIKIGSIIEGRITGITKYGAFVTINRQLGGMVHISEISQGFVKDVNEHLKLNQIIKAVVIAVNDDGKLALSIKRALKDTDDKTDKADKIDKIEKSEKSGEFSKNPEEYFSHNHRRHSKNTGNTVNFEDMMSRFKNDSDEKFSDLKKSLNSKKTRRRPNQNN